MGIECAGGGGPLLLQARALSLGFSRARARSLPARGLCFSHPPRAPPPFCPRCSCRRRPASPARWNSGAESSDMQQESTYEVEFWSLKHIHLHELPRLRGICGGNARLSAPDLETIKIRGCWSLKRLPAVIYNRSKVKCDCEKEWWDMLEWDGSASHHPDLYQPTHPRYYKKRMLRGSVLV